MLIIYAMAFSSGGYVCYSFDFFTTKPAYLCENPIGSGKFESCNADVICSKLDNEIPVNYKIDWNDQSSLDNWVS